jgi:hypothetical protein
MIENKEDEELATSIRVYTLPPALKIALEALPGRAQHAPRIALPSSRPAVETFSVIADIRSYEVRSSSREISKWLGATGRRTAT